METTAHFTADDIRYIEKHFMQIETPAPERPAPSYVLDDGRAFYPRSYIDGETDELRFKARLAAACAREGIASLDPQQTWAAYMDGTYGVCLKSPTPENIARKTSLLQRIETLTATPNDGDPAWRAALKHAVDTLDELEQPFSPHFDRARFGRPPTRDTHIAAVRERFAQIAT